MADKNFALLVELKADIEQFKKSMDGAKKKNNTLLSSFKKLAPAMSAAFATGAIINFSKEAILLAAKLEGVETAFDKLENSAQILKDLKAATRDTVSEFKLMQMTVEASNMGIPIKDLATMFEFATKQAIRTGKSVDYLIEQLVLGIGRKSVQRLDDLGISLVQIQTELAITGDFATAVANIINRNLGSMGEVASTAATKFQVMRTAWDDFKADAGTKMLEIFYENYRWQKDFKYIMNSGNASGWDKFNARSKRFWGGDVSEWHEFAEALRELDTATEEVAESTEEVAFAFNRAGLASIDFAGYTKTLLDEWIKENDILRERIKNQEDLTAALNESRLANLALIKEMGGEFQNPYVGRGEEAMAWDYLNNDEEVIDEPGLDAIIENYRSIELETQAFVNNMNAMLTSVATAAIVDSIAGLFEGLASGDMEGYFNDILGTFGNFMIQMGEMIIGYGIAMEAFKKAFSNPYVAIAAGAALIAIGGAIIGAHNSFTSGGDTSSTVYSEVFSNPQANVTFEIEGDKLIGVINNYNRKSNNYR